MPETVLTLRQLNRATLQRQMLLERHALPIPQAISRLVGLQAQAAPSPYIGLWTRLLDFQRDALAQLIEQHAVVKATFLRATLHLLTAADFAHLRATLQPLLSQASEDIAKQRGAEFDVAALLAETRADLAAQPRTFKEISELLAQRYPHIDVGALRYTVRTHLPLVQVPTHTRWSYPGNPAFALAEEWIEQPFASAEDPTELVRRYLAAFGPASVTDIQTWCGLAPLKDTLEALRPTLQTYRDENRRELFDLPGLPLPPAGAPAPLRFLPEYDNLLLSHSNRRRVIADVYRKRVYLPGLRVAGTVLIDGFVGATWKIEKNKKAAALRIEPFAPLTAALRAELSEEGERLLRFVESEAQEYSVNINEA